MPRVKKNPNRRAQAAMPKDHSPSSPAIPQGPEASGSASMPPQKLAMKWNNHKINIVSVLGSYVVESKFVDVTILCEGQKIKAHQLVLSASSPYFHDIFLENPCQHPVFIIHGFKYEIIKLLLQFIYKGEVSISQHDIPSFLQAAELFEIKGLSMNQERPQNEQSVPMKTDMPPRKENRKRSISDVDQKDEDNAKKINQQPLSNGIQQYGEADEEIEDAKSLEQNLTAADINEMTKLKTMPDVEEPGHLPAFGLQAAENLSNFPAQASESQEDFLTENPCNFPAEASGSQEAILTENPCNFPAQASESQELFLTENPCNVPAQDIRYNNENEPSPGSLDENIPDDECSQPEIICISDKDKGIISL